MTNIGKVVGPGVNELQHVIPTRRVTNMQPRRSREGHATLSNGGPLNLSHWTVQNYRAQPIRYEAIFGSVMRTLSEPWGDWLGAP